MKIGVDPDALAMSKMGPKSRFVVVLVATAAAAHPLASKVAKMRTKAYLAHLRVQS